MKIEKIIRVKKIWHNLDLKVKYCYKIIKTLVSMNSQVSHNLVSSEFTIKREKNGFQFIATLHELVFKTVRKEKGEKKRKRNRPYFNFSFKVDMDLRKLRDGNFCRLRTLNSLKTTVKTAAKSFTSVWINSLLLMRINAIRFVQSKWTINGQELKIKALFLSVVIS